MNFRYLLLAELRRSWLQSIRYPAEVIGGVVIITSVFYGLFLSAQYMTGSSTQFGDRLDAIVIGYVLWTLTIYLINDIATNLQIEAQTGTLEQVFLSPFGAPKVFLARAIASLSLRFTLISGILLIIMGLTGSRLQFPILSILPFLTMLLGGYGLAFLMGSCSLLFKQVQQVLGLFQFVLLFLLAIPTESWTGVWHWISFVIPMIPSVELLRILMAQGSPWESGQFAIALLNGLVYFTLGLQCFRWAEQHAKQQGILSGY